MDQLLNLDPFDNKGKHFFCTVTVESLSSEQRWWFFSCDKCHRSATPVGQGYNCAEPSCVCTNAGPAYSICVVASDDTARAEFILFDKAAREITGKPAMGLLRRRYPGYTTIQEIAQVARADPTAPPEVKHMLGQKYKFVVSISSKSFNPNSRELSFQVNRVAEVFKPHLSSSPFVSDLELGGSSSTTALKLLGPANAVITPRTPSPSLLAPATGYTEMFGSSPLSPPVEPPTPEFHLLAGQSTPPGPAKPTCPHRGTRVSLFSSPAKAKEESTSNDGTMIEAVTDPASEDPDTAHPVLPVPVSDQPPTAKPKRTSVVAKAAGGGKKSKQ